MNQIFMHHPWMNLNSHKKAIHALPVQLSLLILLFLAAGVSFFSSEAEAKSYKGSGFHKRLSKERFKMPPSEVIMIAKREAFEDFPTAIDIISIARIESTFNPNARNKMSNGIMQVNFGSFDLEQNMISGVSILRDLFVKLGSAKAAIIAYNIGIGNYYKRRFMISGNQYHQRYIFHRRLYNEEILREYVPNNIRDIDSNSASIDMDSFFSSGGSVQYGDRETYPNDIPPGESDSDQVSCSAPLEIREGVD